MICPSCSMKNNYYHRYCFNCGTRLINEEVTEEKLQLPDEDQYDKFAVEEEYEEVVDAIVEDSPYANEFMEPADIDDSTETEDLSDSGDIYDSNDSYDEVSPTDSTIWEDSEDEQSEEEKEALYTGNFEDIFSDLELYYKDESDTEFDIQTQLPLRRYRRAKKNTDGLQRVLKAFITIVLISLIGLLVYIGYVELFQKPAGGDYIARSIDLDYRVEETNLDGQSARKIIVLSSIGEQVKIKDQVAAIIGGKAEIILPDSEFGINEYEQADGALQVSIPVTVLADGYPNRTEDIYFEVPVQTAPVEFLSPAGKEAYVDGSVYQLILKVVPGSTVHVGGNNYSHVVDEEGQLSLQLELSDQPETRYEIRVSTRGYADSIEELVFKRKQMDFPLAIDQQIPIEAIGDIWVEVTGNTHPEATLFTNLEVRDEIKLDTETGNFQLFVKAPDMGYTPLILTAQLEGKEDSVLETVIHRPVNESEYTHSAWAFDYDNLKAFPDLHNGVPFLITGTVIEVESTGTKTTLLVNVAAQGQPEKLVYVDYWGTSNTVPGQQLRIFGNRWGNKDDNPYIIASYIYK